MINFRIKMIWTSCENDTELIIFVQILNDLFTFLFYVCLDGICFFVGSVNCHGNFLSSNVCVFAEFPEQTIL